jgi:IS30 family transposase
MVPARKMPLGPVIRREVRRGYWCLVAAGVTNAEASVAVGVSPATGWRWVVNAGGMAPLDLDEPSGRYLSFAEREEIAILWEQKLGVREIARQVGRSPSTISRELRRNCGNYSGATVYRASAAHKRAEWRLKRPKEGKLAANERLRVYVQAKLSGEDKGLGRCTDWRARRKDGRWGGRWDGRWSPEQISARLVMDFPDDGSMRISHETIYRALYVQGRGELRRELTACLRTGRALRKPRRQAPAVGKRQIPAGIMISQRPAEVEDRAVPGHWEGDLIIGSNSSAIGTLVERKTRFVLLLHLPRLPQFAPGERGWSGRGAEAVRDAITATITTLPQELRRSLTWDQGNEMVQHAQLRIDTGLDVYFCDPHSPWQRGTNENTNGLLRQYFPKGTDLLVHSPEDLAAVAASLNGRPRKTLGWRTPAETLTEELLSIST